MKFPKERVRILSSIKNYQNENNYFAIFKMKEEIISHFEDLKETTAFESLVKATFLIGNFDATILIGDSLRIKGYESYVVLYYMLLSYIANVDIYQGVLLIKSSKLLKDVNTVTLYDDGGSNYLNVLNTNESIDFKLALIITNFVLGISKEMMGNAQVDREYLLFRFFDLVDMLYELGYEIEYINNLQQVLKIVFTLDI